MTDKSQKQTHIIILFFDLNIYHLKKRKKIVGTH